MVSDPEAKTSGPAQAVSAVVFSVRDDELQVLLWERALEPFAGRWSLPGGALAPGETLEQSIRRHLETKVDVRELSHLEQLETLSDPGRNPLRWEIATAYLGLVPSDVDPELPPDTHWQPVAARLDYAYDHELIVLSAWARLRGKLSYTNIGFALAPDEFTISELRDLYRAALGHDVSATNLQRVLLRRHLLEPTGGRREPGPTGGRPAALFRFRLRELHITDQFAVLRPRRG
jgi:ADP-ribose pyrophosphatase YjhB (NUDIX family)